MKLKIFLGIAFWTLLLLAGCNRDDINFDTATQKLRFSADTLFCDTVYSQMRSETYAVKVYNTENKDVTIPKIYLESGTSSLYRINIDGKTGTDFNDVALRKNDSLYVFVEIAPIANATEAIAEDKVVFETGAGTQKVTLLSVVQDAEYFIQTGDTPYNIDQNTTWTNEKVKVIFGKLNVAEGKTLNIEKGTKVYFHKNAEMTISKNSMLNVNGELGQEVTFRGDRSDTKYDTLPANWKGIKMEEASVLNMNYGKLYGGIVGLELKDNTATIKNSIFHTFQSAAILGINTTLYAENVVINNCGEADLAISKGGHYELNYCTFANYWNLNASMPAYSLYASNLYENSNGEMEVADFFFRANNSIFYVDNLDAISLNPTEGIGFDYRFDNSLIKYSTRAGFTLIGDNIIENEDPKFLNYFTQKMNLRVKDDSPAKGKAVAIPGITKDIVGITRSNPSTLGAYQ